jgi:branched-chain amino acid transport system substrate-binding protein
LAFGVAACGDDDKKSEPAAGGSAGGSANLKATIYSSLPLQGASRPQTTAMVNGIKLALKEQNNKAGNTTITYESLDDSTAQAGKFTVEQESANARKAVQDDTAVAYIGAFNSGASEASIPLLNEGGIAQISPANTYVGLTKNEPGTPKDQPSKYYPTGKRTYTRIIPRDSVQAAADVKLMQDDGCKNVFITNDKDTYGQGIATNVETAAKKAGLEVLGNSGIDTKAPNFRSLAQKIKAAGTECFFFGGITAAGAIPLYKDVGSALPNAKLYGPDGVCESGFTDPKKGGVPTSVNKRFKCTVGTPPKDKFPPEGIAFFANFEKEYGDKNPDPYAIYGYEAMKLALDAVERAGDKGNDRAAVLEALFATKDRQSVLGTYSIDADGDTTLTDISAFTVENGEPSNPKIVKAAAA